MLHVLDAATQTESGYFRLHCVDYVCLDILGTEWDTDGTVSVEVSNDDGTNFHPFAPDGTDKSYSADSCDIIHWGGAIFKLTVVDGSGGAIMDIDAWVNGNNVDPWSP